MQIEMILLQYFCLLFSLSVHVAAHAAMAYRCGDDTAKHLGRMTINPLPHIDPLGTVVFPLIMMITQFPYMFGWAKPVPFNPLQLNDMRRDPVFISLAGPGSNFTIAILGALVLRILAVMVGIAPGLQLLEILITVFTYLVYINILLMLFNLIPLPPLDGHHVLGYFLPPSGQRLMEQIGPFGIIIALVLINNFRILEIPIRVMTTLLYYVAFWGTPIG
jgi:Zn-dependent protease